MAKNAATEAALGSLHETLATVLTDALKAEGGAPAAVLAVAAKFLKDNDITCSVDESNKMGELKRELEAHGAPGPAESDATLQAALDDVVNLEEYRGRITG